MVLDHRADRGLVIDGSSLVQTWDDQSVSARHLTSVAGREPLYVNSVSGFGKPGVLFATTGSDDAMDGPAVNGSIKALHGSAGATLLLAFRPGTRTDSTLQLIASNNTTASTQHGFAWYYVGSAQQIHGFLVRGSVPAAIDQAVTCSRNAPHVVIWRHASAQTNDSQMWVDGTQLANADYTAAPSGSDPTNPLRYGCVVGGTTLGFDGHIIRHCGWNRALSDAEIAQVLAYSASEWGI